MIGLRLAGLGVLTVIVLTSVDANDPPQAADLKKQLPPIPPQSLDAALGTFRTQAGFTLQRVAGEPQVVDPIAVAYDADGRMYAIEMRDYPDPLPPGATPQGRVRLLTDRDDDGVYEQASIFAEGLPWPTGVCCWDGGVFVTAAPDIWYLKDTTGDGQADVRKKVFTGFVVYNVQALVNGLQWGVDNRIYGVTAGNGGTITRVDRPDLPAVPVRGKDFRFDPRTLEFEAISGTAQFGNTFDDWYNRFLCANRLVAGHVVIPAEYLARNPSLPAARVVQDCAAEGINVPLPMFQVSAAEPWRDVRTRQYHAEGTRLPPSEMVATGLFTSGTGITIYRGSAYPEEYRGNAFVGNVAGNLIHRRTLTPKGATFIATRADKECEFVASTDNWFRPCNMANAPDGTLHIMDMYREVVEHPWSIPDNIKQHLDLSSGKDRGRIYRLAPPGYKHPKGPRLSEAPSADLVSLLVHGSSWWRETAQRLLIERNARETAPAIRKILHESPSPLGRLHALWTLESLGLLEHDDILVALQHDATGLREHGIRLAERRIAESPDMLSKIQHLATDSDPRVRFQVALSIGQHRNEQSTNTLAKLAVQDAGDPWSTLAILSSAKDQELALAKLLLNHSTFADNPGAVSFLQTLAATIPPRRQAGEVEQLVQLGLHPSAKDPLRQAILTGLAEGLTRTGRTLASLSLPADSAEAQFIQTYLATMQQRARDAEQPPATRVQAIALLAHARWSPDQAQGFRALLDPREPQEIQVAAIRALRLTGAADVPAIVLGAWPRFTPTVRAEAVSTLASRPNWAGELMEALEARRVPLADISLIARTTLVNHRDGTTARRAKALFATGSSTQRAEVVKRYEAVLKTPGDVMRGRAVFTRECAACHYADGVGTSIGPAIAAVGTRTPEALLISILDPNREVDPRYVSYAVETVDGRTFTGIITAESATSVTLRASTGAVETILRSEITSLKSQGVSLMPDGLEERLPAKEMTDLLAFLMSVQS